MANEIQTNKSFNEIVNRFAGSSKNIRVKEDQQGGFVLYTNDSRLERLKDWFSTSHAQRQENREFAKAFILDKASNHYNSEFPLEGGIEGVLNGTGLLKLSESYQARAEAAQQAREAADQQELAKNEHQKLRNKVDSTTFDTLLKLQRTKLATAEDLRKPLGYLERAINKSKEKLQILSEYHEYKKAIRAAGGDNKETAALEKKLAPLKVKIKEFHDSIRDEVENFFTTQGQEIGTPRLGNMYNVKEAESRLSAMQTHVIIEKQKAKLDDGNIGETIAQLRANIQALNQAKELARKEYVPFKETATALAELTRLEELQFTEVADSNSASSVSAHGEVSQKPVGDPAGLEIDSAPESSSTTSVATKNTENKHELPNGQVSDVTSELLLKSNRTLEEKKQVVDDFMKACKITRADLTAIVENVLGNVCDAARLPKPTSGMAERIINQRIYGSFDAYSPVPYPDMGEPFISLNQSEDFKDIFQNGLTEALISAAKSQLSTGPYEPKRPPEQAHYNVVDKTDSSKIIQIPDDGVCMFAAYLYADTLNKQDVNKS